MEESSKNMSCRYCRRNFNLKGLIQHGVQSKKCKKFFNPAQIGYLKEYSNEISKAKHKAQMALRYQRNKNQIFERNQRQKGEKAKEYARNKIENPDVYKKKRDMRLANYDKEKRAEKYQREKFSLAQKYQANRDQIAQKYQANKDQIAKKYQANRDQIAQKYHANRVQIALKNQERQKNRAKEYDKNERSRRYKNTMVIVAEKRKELKENKESEAGKYFVKYIVEPIVEEVYSRAEDDAFDYAFDIALKDYENHCNQAVEAVFDDENKFMSEIRLNLSIDCEYRNYIEVKIHKGEEKPCSYWTEELQKPCIDHMSNTEWEKVIDKAMEKTYDEKKTR